MSVSIVWAVFDAILFVSGCGVAAAIIRWRMARKEERAFAEERAKYGIMQ